MFDYTTLEGHLRSDLGPWLARDSGGYHSDIPFESAAARALAGSFYKKLCPMGDTSAPDLAALKKFELINDRMLETPWAFHANSEAESCFYDYFKNNLNSALSPSVGLPETDDPDLECSDPASAEFDLDFIRQNIMPGPGAAQKANADTIVTKLFESVMSFYGSDHLVRLYRTALSETGFWADAEKQRFETYGFSRVDGGKAFFALKNAEISRFCCTEASLEMLFQKAVGAFIERRLLQHFGINLSVQPENNKRLARIGSIDGSFGTMDLVSASDMNSCRLIDDSMQNSPLKTMMFMCRSEKILLPNGSLVEMGMISTMGNGFTFPLQTIIFASAVRACYQLMGFPCADPRTQFGVFGDDIIVRREVYEFLSKMLTKLGFEVNDQKSFNSGPFRESCGGDYFNGRNIRGVYIKSLETPQLIVSAINRLQRWSARTGVELVETLRYLRARVPKAPKVPPSEADDAGIQSPFVYTTPKVANNYWFRYRSWQKKVRKVVVTEPDCSANPNGSAVGYLSGHYRRPEYVIGKDFPSSTGSHSRIVNTIHEPVWVSLRDPPNVLGRYKVRSSSIPFWDWIPVGDVWEDVTYDAWKGVVGATQQCVD
jgi:hypothetical protein